MKLTQPEDARRADVIVIGAGVLGTFHAYYAAQMGLKTLLLERHMFPSEASTRNFGMIVESIVETDSEWSAFARASRAIYTSIQQECDISVRTSGTLYIASTELECNVLKEFVQMHSPPYNCVYLDGDEARYRYSFILAQYCKGALLFPDDLTLDPQRMLRQFIPHIVQKGFVDYIPLTTVVDVKSNGNMCVVKDAKGNIFEAERVFVCSGAEYRTLFPELFSASGLRVCKLQMMQTMVQQDYTLPHSILSNLSIQRYPAFKSSPSYPLLQEQRVDQSIRDYGIHLLFKQASDGSVIIGDSHEYKAFQDASMSEEATNCLINEAILQYGQQMITLPSWHIQKQWNGYYLIHPQHLVYTEVIDDRIHVVTGIAGKGMSTGPGFVRKHIFSVLT